MKKSPLNVYAFSQGRNCYKYTLAMAHTISFGYRSYRTIRNYHRRGNSHAQLNIALNRVREGDCLLVLSFTYVWVLVSREDCALPKIAVVKTIRNCWGYADDFLVFN